MDVLHDQEQFLLDDDVQHRRDVRVLNARCKARLVDEHRHHVAVAREVRMQALDGDGAGEANGADEAGQVDRRHAARGDLLEHQIPPGGPGAESLALLARPNLPF